MRESDTGLWLHNKLGATDELWAPPSIASLLTAAVIDNIRLCFHRLSSAVKLKLLLGTLHLPRRAVDEVRRGRRALPAGPLPAPTPLPAFTPPARRVSGGVGARSPRKRRGGWVRDAGAPARGLRCHLPVPADLSGGAAAAGARRGEHSGVSNTLVLRGSS